MRKLKAYQVLCWAAFAIGLFVIMTNTIPNDVLIVLFNGAFIGTCVAIGVVYAPLLLYAFRQREFNRVSQLALGIGCIWVSLAIARITSVVSHATTNPALGYQSPWIVLAAYLALIGGILHVTATGTDVLTNKFQGPVRVLLFVAVGAGVLVSLGVFIAQMFHLL